MYFMRLKKCCADKADIQTQPAPHVAVEKYMGTLSSGNSRRAETARNTIRRRLERQRRNFSG
jgi:hypothetical protein